MKTRYQFAILKDIKIPLLLALMGFIFGIAGSILGAYLTTAREKQKDISGLRVTAYNKFFAGQAKFLQYQYSNVAAEKKDDLLLEYQREIKEARFHIGVISSPEVIKALVGWFKRVEKPTEKNPNWKEDIATYQAMRREILGEGKKLQVDDEALHDLLFRYGGEPSNK